jgi:hypothetical protein
MRKKTYPSDVTREQFERIRPLLESLFKISANEAIIDG